MNFLLHYWFVILFYHSDSCPCSGFHLFFYNPSYLLLLFLEFHCGACVVCKALQVASGYETCFINKFAVAVWEKLANSQRMNRLMHDACTLTLTLDESTQTGGRGNHSRISMAESCKEKSQSLKANCVAESWELAALVCTQMAGGDRSEPRGDRGPPSLTSTRPLGCSATRTQLLSTLVWFNLLLHLVIMLAVLVHMAQFFVAKSLSRQFLEFKFLFF